MLTTAMLLLKSSLFLSLHLAGNISSFPKPLSPEEERSCLERCAQGDLEARNTLIEHNMRLVAHIIKKYYTQSVDQDDLISIGTIGLIKAVDTFDPSRASKFSSYASRCIENELRMELRRTRREGAQVSLQEPLEGGGQLTLADTLPDPAVMEDDCERRVEAERLRRLIRTLPERERCLITWRYGLDGAPPRTQQQVAARLGVSRSYVSRLEKRVVTQLAQRWQNE